MGMLQPRVTSVGEVKSKINSVTQKTPNDNAGSGSAKKPSKKE